MVSQVQRDSFWQSSSQPDAALLTIESLTVESLTSESLTNETALQSAEACIKAKNWPQAIVHAQQAIEVQPSAEAYKLLGNAQLHQKQWQEAQIAYKAALKLQPDGAEIHANLGTLAAHQQQWSESLRSFRQAIALKPDLAPKLKQNLEQLWTQIERSNGVQVFFSQPQQFDAIDHQTLGDRLIKREQLGTAVRCYENAVAIDPTLATAFWNLSLAYKQLGNPQAMISAYFRALCLQPDWATAAEHCKLGNHFLQQEEWTQAIACYERTLEQDTAQIEAHLGLGMALQKQGEFTKAIAHYQQAIQLQPEAWLAYHNLGDILLAQQQWTEAIAHYQQAIDRNGQHSWSYNNLGDAYRNLGNWQAAIEGYRQAIALKPDFHWSHYNLGDALAKLEQWDEAIAAYRSAIALKPDLTIAHHKLSRALHQRAEADLSLALSSYLHLIQHNPNDIESYHGALKIQRDDPQLYVGLANALANQNQLDQAIVFYHNALLLQPDHAEAKQQLQEITARKNQITEVIGFNAPSADYALWLRENMPEPEELLRMAERATTLKYKPLISIIVPVYNPPEQFLREMIESVLDQVYPDWELCIADDCSTKSHVRRVLKEYAAKDARIKVAFRETNGHISAASNSALKLATGEYITLLDHDDLLTPDALYEVASLLNQHPEADMIYSDEDKVNERRELLDPYFKPDWCPDFFLSQNYICHLGTYRRTIVNQIGGFRIGYEGSQDYDLTLRLVEKTNNIFHIPKVLYHWRIHSESTAGGDAKPYAYDAGARALQDALDRRGEKGKIISNPNFPGVYTVRYRIHEHKRVSIIIPTRNLGDVLDRCLRSIFEKSTYPNYEVILVDNGSDEAQSLAIFEDWKRREPDRFRCHRLDIPFNYSRLNNYGVAQASGDYLLFLNNDTEVITSDWIEAMVEQAQRPGVGAIGALLLYPDDTIQHAGVIVGLGGVAGHSHKYFEKENPGYFRKLLCVSNYSAVTAACVMCRRDAYEQIGGFDETLKVAFNDVDFCLRLKQQGYHNLFLPHVSLYHYESKSRGVEDTPEKQQRFQGEIQAMKDLWSGIIAHDPCYSPHLTRDYENYEMRIPTRPEILEVSLTESSIADFWGFSIDSPTVSKLRESSITIDGWVLGRASRVTAVEIFCNSCLIERIETHILRPDIKEVFAHVFGAEQSGFTTFLNVAKLPTEAEIVLQAVFEHGAVREMGKIKIRC